MHIITSLKIIALIIFVCIAIVHIARLLILTDMVLTQVSVRQTFRRLEDNVPYRTLTQDELKIFSTHYPKEHFEQQVYRLCGRLHYASTTRFNYLMLNDLRIFNECLDTEELNEHSAYGDQGVYEVVRGKKKAYLLKANGLSISQYMDERDKKYQAWCAGIDSPDTLQQQVRIIGQRKMTPKEARELQLIDDASYTPAPLSLGTLLLAPTVFCLCAYCETDAPSWLGWLTLLLGGVVFYSLFIHRRLTTVPLGRVNIIYGQLSPVAENGRLLLVGNMDVYFPHQDMSEELERNQLYGKARAVEVTTDYFNRKVLRIADVYSLDDDFAKNPPAKIRKYLFWIAAICLLGALFLYARHLTPDKYLQNWVSANATTNRHYQSATSLLANPPHIGDIVYLRGKMEPTISDPTHMRSFFWPSSHTPMAERLEDNPITTQWLQRYITKKVLTDGKVFYLVHHLPEFINTLEKFGCSQNNNTSYSCNSTYKYLFNTLQRGAVWKGDVSPAEEEQQARIRAIADAHPFEFIDDLWGRKSQSLRKLLIQRTLPNDTYLLWTTEFIEINELPSTLLSKELDTFAKKLTAAQHQNGVILYLQQDTGEMKYLGYGYNRQAYNDLAQHKINHFYSVHGRVSEINIIPDKHWLALTLKMTTLTAPWLRQLSCALALLVSGLLALLYYLRNALFYK